MGADVRMGRHHAHWQWSGLIGMETMAAVIGLMWQCAHGGKGDCEWRKRSVSLPSGRMQPASATSSRDSNTRRLGQKP